jgi:hypothetical protein
VGLQTILKPYIRRGISGVFGLDGAWMLAFVVFMLKGRAQVFILGKVLVCSNFEVDIAQWISKPFWPQTPRQMAIYAVTQRGIVNGC